MAEGVAAMSGLVETVAAPPAACCDIEFARDLGGSTYLDRQYAAYPFHLCRPHRFEGDPPGMATVYFQSCAGGIFEGDSLAVRVVAGEGAAVHLTSQASTIVHGMERTGARQTVDIDVGAGAFVEYLPDPLILFPQARLETVLSVRLHGPATVILSDAFMAHDPAGADSPFDRIASELAAYDGSGRRLALDRFVIGGANFQAGLPGITGPYRAHGSLLVLHRDRPAAALVDALRHALDGVSGTYAGASTLAGGAGAWMRVLAEDGVSLRAGLLAAWSALRVELGGQAPRPRRK
jgi:urease accessory protein